MATIPDPVLAVLVHELRETRRLILNLSKESISIMTTLQEIKDAQADALTKSTADRETANKTLGLVQGVAAKVQALEARIAELIAAQQPDGSILLSKADADDLLARAQQISGNLAASAVVEQQADDVATEAGKDNSAPAP